MGERIGGGLFYYRNLSLDNRCNARKRLFLPSQNRLTLLSSTPFVPRSRIHSRVTRSCNLLHIPRCRLSSGQRAFRYRGCKLWNNLPNDLQLAENVSVFSLFRRRLLNALLSGKITH